MISVKKNLSFNIIHKINKQFNAFNDFIEDKNITRSDGIFKNLKPAKKN